jgi:hypothetical protein
LEISPALGARQLIVLSMFATLTLAQAPPVAWETVGNAGAFVGPAGSVSLAFDAANAPVVVFKDDANGGRARAERFVGGAWTTVDVGAAGSVGVAFYNSAGVDTLNRLWIAQRDYSIGGRCAVRRADLADATPVFANVPFDLTAISADQAHWTRLTFAPDGTPHVVFADRATNPAPALDPDNDRLTALRWSGALWESFGPPGFTPGKARYPSMVVDGQGVAYAAFTDGASQDRVSVMRRDPTLGTWALLGAQGFSLLTPSLNVNVALDRHDVPHVVFFHVQHVYVMRFDPGAASPWSIVGGHAASSDVAGFNPPSAALTSEAWRFQLSLAFDSANRPYVAYQTPAAAGSKIAVRRLQNGQWTQVGTAGFSVGEAAFPTLTLDARDVPHVAFRDASAGSRIAVMRLAQAADAPPLVLGDAVGDTGRPVLSAPAGNPFIGRVFPLRLASAPPGIPGVIGLGPPASQPLPLGPGDWLYLDPLAMVPLVWFAASAQGLAMFPIPVPDVPALAGAVFSVQAGYLPGGGALPVDLSNALVLTVGF